MPLENKEYMYRLSERLGIEVNDSELDHYKYEISFRTIDVKRYFEDREFIKETKMKNIKLYQQKSLNVHTQLVLQESTGIFYA